jgi:hypothetical protein
LVATDTEVQQLHTAIQVDLVDLWATAEQCKAKLDDATQKAWASMVARTKSYLGDSPSLNPLYAGTQLDAGRIIQTELASWHGKFQAAGCTSVSPAPDTTHPPDFGDQVAKVAAPTLPILLLAVLAYFVLGKK